MSEVVLGNSQNPESIFKRQRKGGIASVTILCAVLTCFFLEMCLQEIKRWKKQKNCVWNASCHLSCGDLAMHLFILISLVIEFKRLRCWMKEPELIKYSELKLSFLMKPDMWHVTKTCSVWWSGSLSVLCAGSLLFDFLLKYLYCLIFSKRSFLLSHGMLSVNPPNSMLLW